MESGGKPPHLYMDRWRSGVASGARPRSNGRSERRRREAVPH